MRLICPALADELVWGQALEGLETAGEVVGIDEVSEMLAQLVVTVVVIAMNGRLFDRAVHALNLAIGPRMPWLGEPVINVMNGTGVFEGMAPEEFAFSDHLLDVSRRPALTFGVSELNAIVCEDRVNLVGNGLNKVQQELFGDGSCCPVVEFHIDKLAGPVDGNKEMKLAFCRSHFGNVDMEIANRISLELLLGALLPSTSGNRSMPWR